MTNKNNTNNGDTNIKKDNTEMVRSPVDNTVILAAEVIGL